jgi:MFS family permease
VGDRAVLACLSTHVFFSWGVLYYTLPILNIRLAQEQGWSTAFVAGVFSSALLVAAIVGVPVGRLVDRHGPAVVMLVGALVAVVAMSWSVWTGQQAAFAAAWMVVGAAHSATLYPPAFTAVARWFDGRTTRPLTVLTLVGGASSLAFAPVMAALADSISVRRTVWILAASYLVVAVVTTVLLRRRIWDHPTVTLESDGRGAVRNVVRSGRFIRLAVAMALSGAGLYAVTLNSVPLMVERGFTFREAATIFGLIGGGQLIGRIAFAPLSRRGTPVSRSIAQAAAAAIAILLMAALGAPGLLVVSAAIFAGVVRGAHTLSTAAALIDRWGTQNYGTVFGRFNFVVAAAIAVGPVLGEGLAAAMGSYEAAAWVLGGIALLAIPLARST